MKRLLLIFALCLPATSAWAQVRAVISGPAESAPGDLVILDSSQSVGALHRRWLLVNSTKTFLPVDNGSKCIFASGQAGEYIFVLVVADGLADVDTDEHRLQIGVGPGPGPGPIPPTPPTPVPGGKLSLLIIRESADSTPELARLITSLRAGTEAAYLKSKQHQLSILDDDSVGADGQPAKLVEQWRPHWSGMTLPVLVIIDPVNKALVAKEPLPETAAGVVDLVKKYGG